MNTAVPPFSTPPSSPSNAGSRRLPGYRWQISARSSRRAAATPFPRDSRFVTARKWNSPRDVVRLTVTPPYRKRLGTFPLLSPQRWSAFPPSTESIKRPFGL